MRSLEPIGRAFFAVGLIAFGVLQFIFGDFIPGRAPPFPASWPGRLVWAYATGVFFVAAGAAIGARARARPAALAAAALIFVWALLRRAPAALASGQLGGEWTLLGKALVLVGGAVAIAAASPGSSAKLVNAAAGLRLGRVCLGAFMVLAGIQHFLFADFVATLVPAWIPGAHFWTYFAAVALIAGGAGMSFPPTERAAAALSGLMIFLWVILLHVPRALAAAGAAALQNEWTAVFEALSFSGLALFFAATARPERAPAVGSLADRA